MQACQLDVTDPNSIERAQARVAADFGGLDVLVNNAAILYDTWEGAVDSDLAQVREALETNLFADVGDGARIPAAAAAQCAPSRGKRVE